MAWDTQETQRRLLEAACAEFADKGPDGATMARISERAGLNKERLYNYFGDKQLLFEAVLTHELDKLAASLSINAAGLAHIGEFTGGIFDYHAEHPELVRLLLWEGLAGGPAVQEAQRSAQYRRTVTLVVAAQQDGVLNRDPDPAKLLFHLIALAAWWFAVPQLARMITGSDGRDSEERKQRRISVVRAAEQLVGPRLALQASTKNPLSRMDDGII